MNITYPIVGIDICSTTLDGALLDASGKFEATSCDNTKAAARKLAKAFAKRKVALVVVEATGGYEVTIMAALAAEGVPFARVNPRQVRDFAKGIGKLAKTDPIDARVLAMFGERARPRVTPLPTAGEARLKALSLRRRQLVDARVAEKNHRAKATEKDIKAGIERAIENLDDEIERIEDAIAGQIAACQPMRQRQELLETIPCIAAATSATVIAELPELGARSTNVLKAPSSASPHSTPIPAVSEANATSKADEPRFAKPSTWPRKPAIDAIQSSSRSTNGCEPRVSRTNNQSSPASASWSPS